MLKARTNHASTALNGEIYAIGGESFLPITTLFLEPQVPNPCHHWMLPGRALSF